MNNDLKNGVYHNLAPYPEIKVERQNKCYAEILMDDYAGLVSEFGAINQYLYHSLDLGKHYPDLSYMWIKIAEIEMHHLDMIGQLIDLLGLKPKYRGSYSTNGKYWSGEFVEYGSNIYEQLNLDIKSEYEAIDGYKRHIAMIDDKYVKAVLSRIILDEQQHIKILKEALQKYCNV